MRPETDKKTVGFSPSPGLRSRLIAVAKRVKLSVSTLVNNLVELHIEELERLTAADVDRLLKEISNERGQRKETAAAPPPLGRPQTESGAEGEDGLKHEKDRPLPGNYSPGPPPAQEEGEGERIEVGDTGEGQGAEDGSQGAGEPAGGQAQEGQDPARGDSQDGGEPEPAQGPPPKPPQPPVKRGRGRPRKNP